MDKVDLIIHFQCHANGEGLGNIELCGNLLKSYQEEFPDNELEEMIQSAVNWNEEEKKKEHKSFTIKGFLRTPWQTKYLNFTFWQNTAAR